MTKTEIWTRVQDIAEAYDFSGEAVKALSELLEPRKGGEKSIRIIKEIDGIVYKNCRFTGLLWPEDELIYQNDEKRAEKKDKGYSKIGISLWSKGQKHIKALSNQLTEQILSDQPDAGKIEELKKDLKEIKDKNLGNDYKWLLKFATKDQLKEIKEKSLPIES